MTSGETDLQKLLKNLKPERHPGEFVFCTVSDITKVNTAAIIMTFLEKEGITIIIPKSEADRLKLPYTFIVAWITFTVNSSLQAVGLTAAFSKALAGQGISCNVVAAFHHDHIFVDTKDTEAAMKVLTALGH